MKSELWRLSSQFQEFQPKIKLVLAKSVGVRMFLYNKGEFMPTTKKITNNQPNIALMSAEELAKYEKIIPGGAERILELAEQQASHAQELENRQLETSAKLKLVRQVITFFLALGTGALGAALLLAGSELAGLLVIVVDAAALAAVSLYGKQN